MKIEDCVSNFLSFRVEKQCISLLLSKAISISIISVACILKIPQIIGMYRTKSNEGLSFINIIGDVIGPFLSAIYSFKKTFPFSTYGENIAVLVQCYIILNLYLSYANKSRVSLILFNLLCFGFTYFLIVESVVPMYYYEVLFSLNVFPMTIGRGSQIIHSFNTKSTGTLSGANYFLNAVGCLLRIYTNSVETNDLLSYISSFVALVLNLGIFAQIVVYTKKDKKE